MQSKRVQMGRPEEPRSVSSFALFEIGFRPFFLLAAFSAIALIGFWLHIYASGKEVSSYLEPIEWHGHEMLFGFSSALIAGFLLTAVRNWTGIETLSGRPLMLLAAVWLVGRLAMLSSLSGELVMVVDLLFLPLLALSVGIPLWRKRQYRNLFIPLLLLAMALLNGLFHLSLQGHLDLDPLTLFTLTLWLLALLMVVMGGRVIPLFIERTLKSSCRRWRLIEVAAIGGVLLLGCLEFSPLGRRWFAALALLVALLNLIRLAGWWHNASFREPLLWVLQLGYLWLVVGLLLKALVALELLEPVFALHAFGMGGVGGLGLGMMVRLSMGQVGRPREVHELVPLAFGSVHLAVMLRVVVIPLFSGGYLIWLALAGGLWIAAFMLFLVAYLPSLIKPLPSFGRG